MDIKITADDFKLAADRCPVLLAELCMDLYGSANFFRNRCPIADWIDFTAKLNSLEEVSATLKERFVTDWDSSTNIERRTVSVESELRTVFHVKP